MGRAQGSRVAIALSGFDTAMGGARRGAKARTLDDGLQKRVFSETQLEAAAAALHRLSSLPEDYLMLEEARVVLEAGNVSEGDVALRELTGLPDENYRVAAEDALRAAGLL